VKRLVALIITVAIVAAILLNVDRAQLWANLKATDLGWFGLALLLFIPQNLIMAYRWKRMASHFTTIGWGRSLAMVLASQTMNIVLPSKMGDLTKAYFLKQTGSLDLARATNLVVFEKMLDMGSLCLLAVLGVVLALTTGIQGEMTGRFVAFALVTGGLSAALLGLIALLYVVPVNRLPFYERLIGMLGAGGGIREKFHRLFTSSHEVMSLLQRKHARRDLLAGLSVLLWVLHLVQIFFFFLSLDAFVPPRAFTALMPLALFVGLLPISLFGVGTRDAAMIYLFAPFHPASTIAGVGFYVSLRYVVPALAGLPFLNRYMGMAKQSKAEESHR
jgi:hypothetical protein